MVNMSLDSISQSPTSAPNNGPCVYTEHRQCVDGSCVSTMDICPEEQIVNETTVFILLTVGLVLIILIVVLYLFRKRSQQYAEHRDIDHLTFPPIISEGENASLYMPPPAYEEVVSSILYPASSQRNVRMSLSEEPRTPPPNYDAALYILAHSNESFCPTKLDAKSPVVRRSVSTEYGSAGNIRASRSSESDYLRQYSNPDTR